MMRPQTFLASLTIATCSTFGIAATADADLLLGYTFEDDSFAPSFEAEGVSGNSFNADGAGENTQVNNFQSMDAVSVRYASQVAGAPTTEAEAIATGVYGQFTLTPEAALQSIARFDFEYRRGGTSQDRSFALYYSVGEPTGDFETDWVHVGTVDTPDGTAAEFTPTGYDLNLTEVTEPVTFRFYVWTPSINTGGYDMRFTNFEINGVIPEPASAMLAGFGSLLLLGRRRRSADN
ncbi:hypothetical protein ACERK3_11155 [Phycisphaerales bacterium AB-hyl4]|uniref:PEP-CTERM protein-sorting domain-containing protein n=1 Tax=Natronomicrosphaera hydrolytica TaxID=3242702 RepID=A0ABV4U5N5_9BACT